MPEHRIAYYGGLYRDDIAYCRICGKEGAVELAEPCIPLSHECSICGHEILTNQSCRNCQEISEKWQSAVDKQNNRN